MLNQSLCFNAQNVSLASIGGYILGWAHIRTRGGRVYCTNATSMLRLPRPHPTKKMHLFKFCPWHTAHTSDYPDNLALAKGCLVASCVRTHSSCVTWTSSAETLLSLCWCLCWLFLSSFWVSLRILVRLVLKQCLSFSGVGVTEKRGRGSGPALKECLVLFQTWSTWVWVRVAITV